MDGFDPSPRASKRRTTATYATSQRTVASSPSVPEFTPPSTTRRASRRTRRQEEVEEPEELGDAAPKDVATSNLPQDKEPIEEHPSHGSGERNTLENEVASTTASARKKGRPRRSMKDPDAAKDVLQSPADAEQHVQPRSSGGVRRSVRKSDATVVRQSEQPSRPQIQPSSKSNGDKPSPAKVFSPQPKGILTPSKHGRGNRAGPRKSVAFDDGVSIEGKDEKGIEEHFGFKDINSSSKKNRNKRVWESPDEQEADVFEDAAEYPADQLVNGVGDEEILDGDSMLEDALEIDAILPASHPPVKKARLHATEDDDPTLTSIKLQILYRMTSHSHTPSLSSIPSYLSTQYASLHALLSATISAGESNSLLLLGSRGSGKSLLVECALSDLSKSHRDDFHVVRLNGFFQTDDKLAQKEIWRQLGREMAVSEDETGEVSSYADTMASLLSLLSHPEELESLDTVEVDRDDGERPNKTSKSVIFIMDEFDLFTTHPRQTLLYNLFDIAQSKKAPIAVIGCSTRMDVGECLEKRVKSRFSHRWLHIPAAKSPAILEEIAEEVLCLPTVGKEVLGVTKEELNWRERWNEYIKTHFLPAPSTQAAMKKIFHSTKSLPELLAALYIPIATLSLPVENNKNVSRAKSPLPSIVDTVSISTPSLLTDLPHLPILHLSLLISATRLETIYDITMMNFTLVYKHYTELLTRSKLQRSSLSSLGKGGAVTGAGLRSWSKETARGAWEELAQWDLIVPASGGSGRTGDEGLGGDGIVTKMFRVDVTLEDVAWAVKEKLGSAGAGDALMKWCKEA
ncbi:origin recognition complex subunit 4 [Cladophialophora chaetospira]|uniref:Origin recognition complex subunit 4 n=1 Tax=Cladophialophora chaetospira TaxID=386627 RepID=A0AA39CFS0_9EURO|nr:origin recognition complex subunit 4 [Cladophialophora chaetospira]